MKKNIGNGLMRRRIVVLGIIALISSIFIGNLLINLESNARTYGSTYELNKEEIDYFLFDNLNNLSLRVLWTTSNTLVSNNYYSLCRRGNESVLHEVEFSPDLSEINNIQETVLPFLNSTYQLASNGSCFWTLDKDVNLICFTKQELLNVSSIKSNLSSIYYTFPILGLRYWDKNLYVLGENFTETNNRYFYIAKLNLETLKFDFILEDNEILLKEDSVFDLSNGFDIDDQGYLWIASENSFRYVGLEIYSYDMIDHNILSRYRLDKNTYFSHWIPKTQFEEKWINVYPIWDIYDIGSMSITEDRSKIIVPFTTGIYNNEEWLFNVFGGLIVYSFYKSPFPWIEVFFWGGGIFIPVITIVIIILNSKMKFKQVNRN